VEWPGQAVDLVVVFAQAVELATVLAWPVELAAALPAGEWKLH
jgi:hypothetical protein